MDAGTRRRAADALRAIKRGGEGWFSLSDAVLGRPAPRDEVVARLADLIDPGEDVSMSAYDLLPEDERDAIAWVREHGGLSRVKEHWSGRVAQSHVHNMAERHKAKIARMQRHIEFVQGKCRERQERIAALNKAVADMRPRLMPEGMEWPCFEDSEPVRIGDEFTDGLGRPCICTSVELLGYEERARDALVHWDDDDPNNAMLVCMASGDRVKRPAPKVLDADGVEIRVGDTVWHVSNGIEFTVVGLPKSEEYQAVKLRLDDGAFTGLDPDQLTHRAPVLASDGEPLRVGEHVWHVETGAELVVKGLPKPEEYQAVVVFALPASHLTSFDPDQLTHQRPVLDADGVPIKVGDTVYDKDTGDRFEVGGFSYDCVVCTDIDACESDIEIFPSQLTHTKPEPPDSWQRIEADLRKRYIEYWGCSGYGCSDCPSTVDGKRPMDLFDASCKEAMHKDIVRRCKALAEKGETE